tara:strand:+ start:408 stop:1190 length:783 start_codon:yes stop_codon:yes gene_type:complete
MRRRLSNLLAVIIFKYYKKRQDLAYSNLMQAFPEQTKIWREKTLLKSYKFFFFQFFEFLSFPGCWEKIKFNVNGKHYLDNALKEKKGILLITAHFGSWEMLSFWLGKNRYEAYGVAQKQKNKGANDFFKEQRSRSGVFHIFRKSGLDKFYKVLDKNNILGLVSDQDANKKGVFVKFFNKLASTPKGTALFYQNRKSPMIFAICTQVDDFNYNINFSRLDTTKDDTTSITQSYTTMLENFIIKNPSQYFWFHNRWKTRPLE